MVETLLIESSRGCYRRSVWVGGAFGVVPARHVQTNALYIIHVAIRCMSSYERMILSPQFSICFVFHTREIAFLTRLQYIPLSRDTFRDAVSVSADSLVGTVPWLRATRFGFESGWVQ